MSKNISKLTNKIIIYYTPYLHLYISNQSDSPTENNAIPTGVFYYIVLTKKSLLCSKLKIVCFV